MLSLILNNNEFPVVEFSTEGENIYTILENYVLSTGGKIDKTERKVLYSILPFQYGLKYKKDGKTKIIDTMFGEQNLVIYKDISKKLKQFNKVKKVDEVGINSGTIWDGIIDYSELPGTYVASKSIIGASSFEPSIMTDFRQDKGNCAPTAITNLMKYYYQKRNKTKILVNNSVEDTYEKIVELAGKEEGYYWSEIKSVTVDYLNYVKYNYSTVNYWFDYWSDFKRDLDDDWPVLTAVDHFNDKGERTGHTVVALGYHIRKVDGKDVNFLQVADGWYRTTFRYLNFDYYKSVLIDGFCVKVYDLK